MSGDAAAVRIVFAAVEKLGAIEEEELVDRRGLSVAVVSQASSDASAHQLDVGPKQVVDAFEESSVGELETGDSAACDHQAGPVGRPLTVASESADSVQRPPVDPLRWRTRRFFGCPRAAIAREPGQRNGLRRGACTSRWWPGRSRRPRWPVPFRRPWRARCVRSRDWVRSRSLDRLWRTRSPNQESPSAAPVPLPLVLLPVRPSDSSGDCGRAGRRRTRRRMGRAGGPRSRWRRPGRFGPLLR